MTKYYAVIDTNVLFSGLYSNQGASYKILDFIEKGKIIPYLSTTLVFEYEDILKRKQAQLLLSSTEIDDILNTICAKGIQKKVSFLWRPQLRDPKDDHILELAVASNNADIISHNVKDFDMATQFSIRVLTPSQLLRNLL